MNILRGLESSHWGSQSHDHWAGSRMRSATVATASVGPDDAGNVEVTVDDGARVHTCADTDMEDM